MLFYHLICALGTKYSKIALHLFCNCISRGLNWSGYHYCRHVCLIIVSGCRDLQDILPDNEQLICKRYFACFFFVYTVQYNNYYHCKVINVRHVWVHFVPKPILYFHLKSSIVSDLFDLFHRPDSSWIKQERNNHCRGIKVMKMTGPNYIVFVYFA